jgi:putative SOS response-associated peptidase YedK
MRVVAGPLGSCPVVGKKLWERWNNPNGKTLETCSILTTTPNAVTAAVHDRMPAILEPGDYDFWRPICSSLTQPG